MKLSANRLFLLLLGATEITTLAFMSTAAWSGLLALVGLAFLPGALVLLLLRPGRLGWLEKLLYSTSLSVLMLMVSGLAANTIVPLALHNQHPLAPNVQTPWTGVLMFALLIAAWVRNRRRTYVLPRPQVSLAGVGLAAAWLVLPLLSALGAIMQNNDGSDVLSVAMYLLAAAGAVALVALQKRVPAWLWPWALFNTAVALLWSTSLRGWYITGHDVQLEYYVYQLTSTAGQWSMSHFKDPYNACLSITILPTVLNSLTRIGAIPLYKVAYQVWFALSMTGIWLLARRYLTPALAFIATFIALTFPTFYTDMPMLNRQEVAFGFFMVLLLALFNQRWSVGKRRFIVTALVLGVVLSHYSTTFVAVAMLGGAYLWTVPAKWRARWRGRVNTLRPSGLSIGAVVVMLVAVMVWTGLYTKTGTNISQTLGEAIRGLPTLLAPKQATDNSSYSLLKSVHVPAQLQLNNYVAIQTKAAAQAAASQGGTYPNAGQYHLTIVQQPTLPLTPVGRVMQWLGAAPGAVIGLAKTGYALGLQALIIIGVGYTMWRRRWLNIEHDLVGLSIAAIALLGLQAALTVVDYGILRLLQQALMFLGVPIVLGTMQLLKFLRVKTERTRQLMLTAGFGLIFLVLSGIVGVAVGGTEGTLPLNNSGFYYDAYYTSSQDISTFAWLKSNYPAGYPIYSDTFTRTKILANTGITTVDGLVPGEITRQSYVVLTGANVTDDRVSLYLPAGGSLESYQYPTGFLNSNKNLVYSTSTTRVYH